MGIFGFKLFEPGEKLLDIIFHGRASNHCGMGGVSYAVTFVQLLYHTPRAMSNLKPLSAKYLKTALIFVCGCIDMWEDCKQDNKQVQVKIHFYSLTQCENHSYPCSMPSWDFFFAHSPGSVV